MLRVRILGSGSAIPIMGRSNAAVLLLHGDRSYLLDAGESCAPTLLRAGLDLFSLRAVFISHMHADHIAGLPMLLEIMHLLGQKEEELAPLNSETMQLFLPSEAVKAWQQFQQAMYLSDDAISFDMAVKPIKKGPFHDDDRIKVIAHENKHLKNNRSFSRFRSSNKGQSYSFRVESQGKVLVYSGDIKKFSELLPILDDADTLLLEMAHCKPDNLQELADCNVRNIVLTHLHDRYYDRPADLLEAARKILGPKVTVAEDNLELEL